jgi:hypothetical protein
VSGISLAEFHHGGDERAVLKVVFIEIMCPGVFSVQFMNEIDL